MPFRAPKMYGFIFGFQRLVWWPKCTPASRRFFIVTSVIRGAGRSTLPSHSQSKRDPVPETEAPRQSKSHRASLAHRIEELLVLLRSLDLVLQELHGLHGVQL